MKRYGLIGKSLKHSFSKKYFDQKFNTLQLNEVAYDLFELSSIDDLPSLIDSTPSLEGFSVTIPYKESIISYLDWIDPQAEKAGAVNTIKIHRKGNERKLHGFNTDVYGFEHSLKPLLKSHHQRALILGTGGAAKAVACVLTTLHISFKYVSRTPSSHGITYNELTNEDIITHTVIVNATPLGTFPDTQSCPPIPYKYINSSHLLFDLVYNPEETLFMRKGKERGALAINGLHMLQLQADKAWEIWNDEMI
jgi:shikimate dehydrogenase